MSVTQMLVESIEGQLASRGGSGDLKRILVCVPRYLPGYKYGGPTRCIANLVANLSAHFDFYVITRDRDEADTRSYPGVTSNKWHRVGKARVFYCSSIGPAIVRRAIRDVKPDLIYLNSFYETLTRVVLLLRRLRLLGSTPILLAPRGEFSPEAMKIKAAKKILYRHFAKLLGFYDNLQWLASTSREERDLLRVALLNPDSIQVAYEMSDAIASKAPHAAKEPGSLKLAFIARINIMKNLHFLLEILREIQGTVQLNLFGPVAENDGAYWKWCRTLLAQLPYNVKAEYHGSLDHSAVPDVLHDHHFLVLPTRGENFCHVVVESFVHGTPVVLSDETPWTRLIETRAGFDIPLKDRRAWTAVLQSCVDMDQQTYDCYLDGATEYGRRFSVEQAIRQHLATFEAVLRKRRLTPHPTE
jgi:glycosyltransferase involved in cell wall biosynthesis